MRNVTRRRLLVFAVIGALAVVNAGAKYAGLTDLIRDTSYSVAVELDDSGGLFEAAEVTYRGVRVGTVDDLEFVRDGVVAHLEIDRDVVVPRDVLAEVHNRSAVGEQYLDLIPQSADGPVLADGDRIGREATSTPVGEEEILLGLDRFIGSIDTADLQVVVEELGLAFGGHGDDLGRLIDNAGVTLDAARQSLPDLESLLRDGGTVLQTQSDLAPQLATTFTALADVTGVLAHNDAAVSTILADAPATATALSDLADDLTPLLPALLGDLATLAAVPGDRLESLEQTLVTAPLALASGLTPGRDNKSHFALAIAQAPDVCRVGFVPADQWRSPDDHSLADVPSTIGCAEPLPSTPRGGTQLIRQNDPSRFP